MNKEEGAAYHAMTAADALRAVGSRLAGLRDDEVRAQRALYGENRLPPERRAGALRIFVRQFRSVFALVLWGALGASLILRETADALLIAVILCVQAVLGFAQEYRADKAFERLAAYLPRYAQVRRGERIVRVRAEEVVVGDIIVLNAGDHVVADARIISETLCEANEASLTGESAAVEKTAASLEGEVALADRVNMLFAGTTLAAGMAEAVVVAVGGKTAFGAITKMTTSAKNTSTPLQMQLAQFSRRIVYVALVVVGTVFVWGLAKGEPILELLPLALALAIAAIPEGMLVILTIILAASMQRMAARKALVRNLVAAETLGSVNVICTDKTGTVTQGIMSVAALWVDGEEVAATDAAAQELLTVMRVGNRATRRVVDGKEETTGSQTEVSLLRYVQEQEVRLPEGYRLLGTLPFDSRNKFSAYTYATSKDRRLIAVGAPDILLDRLDVSDVKRGLLASTIELFSRRGLRVILMATRETDLAQAPTVEDVRDMRVAGLVGLEDAVRPEAAGMIAEATRAGIRTIMLTGDHPGTARAVAAAVGLPAELHTTMTGVEMARLDEHALRSKVGEISIFARIRPEDKLRLVRALQANGAVVAMTGDGVNDAPALRAADIGIAVGSGTDVAKEAADMVLLDNNFATIVVAIREGRAVFDNIRKVIAYFMIGSYCEVVLVLTALVIGAPLPLLPVHILWINVLSDGLAAFALAGEAAEPEAMSEPPRTRFAPLLRRELMWMIVLAAIVMDSILVALLLIFTHAGIAPELIRAILFLALGFASTFVVLTMRSFRRSFLSIPLASNPLLFLALFASLGLLFAPFFLDQLAVAMELPMAALYMAPLLFLLAPIIVLIIESIKFIFIVRK